MLLLSKVNLTEEELRPMTQSFVYFLDAAKDLNHSSWEFATKFLNSHIQAFEEKQIQRIIELAISEKKHRNGESSLKDICNIAAKKSHFLMSDQTVFLKVFQNISSPCLKCNKIHDLTQILALWKVADKDGQSIIKQKSVDYLTIKFDPSFYHQAVFQGVFHKDEHTNFLDQYIIHAQDSCAKFDLKEEKGRWIVQNYSGFNSIECLAHIEADFSKESIQVIAQKSDYYKWLINYEHLDYSTFNFKWLIDACPYYMKRNLNRIQSLKKELAKELFQKYDPELASFYFKYLMDRPSLHN